MLCFRFSQFMHLNLIVIIVEAVEYASNLIFLVVIIID